MPKRQAQKRITPGVIKVTVSNGQARVNLPKKMALKTNLINEDGEPGNVRYLLASFYQTRITLSPVEMTEIEAE